MGGGNVIIVDYSGEDDDVGTQSSLPSTSHQTSIIRTSFFREVLSRRFEGSVSHLSEVI